MNEILRLVGACLIAFLIGALAAFSFGGGILPGLFSGDRGAQEFSARLRETHREARAIAQLAEQENQKLTAEIGELRGELEAGREESSQLREALRESCTESKELREQIEGIRADNQAAQESTAGLTETNQRFRGLIEKIEAQTD